MDIPYKVIYRNDGTLYVITVDEIDSIKRAGLTFEQFGNLDTNLRQYILNHY